MIMFLQMNTPVYHHPNQDTKHFQHSPNSLMMFLSELSPLDASPEETTNLISAL